MKMVGLLQLKLPTSTLVGFLINGLIMNILLIISVIFFIGGLLEDAINAQSFSIQDHPVITLNELGIEGESTLETQKRSSFVVNESYSSLETVDNTLLYTKEYHFKEESKAQKLFKKYI